MKKKPQLKAIVVHMIDTEIRKARTKLLEDFKEWSAKETKKANEARRIDAVYRRHNYKHMKLVESYLAAINKIVDKRL